MAMAIPASLPSAPRAAWGAVNAMRGYRSRRGRRARCPCRAVERRAVGTIVVAYVAGKVRPLP
eukprot:2521968-Prymnesium_polylepis.1